jgi:hypothetical protein
VTKTKKKREIYIYIISNIKNKYIIFHYLIIYLVTTNNQNKKNTKKKKNKNTRMQIVEAYIN